MRGYSVIPKAASTIHQQENFDSLNVKLTAEEHAEIVKVLEKHRLLFFDWPELGCDNIFA